ncbi:GNAT family N-acetyltransferase [Microbacterium sp.]|uniref:GNAT family N-acetyltransferase n=1 Tax=Microbacterium sp. TaxID=51671 RepID=UPI003735CFAE
MPALRIVPDDLTGEAIQALVSEHLGDMFGQGPAESVHALGVEQLRHPDIRFWTAWSGDDLAGMAALRRLSAQDGEIKSMRVAAAHLGTGVGRALVQHLIAQARATGMRALWLETGAQEGFLAARSLYASEGFVECEAFGPYRPDPNSTFMTLSL